MQIVYLGIVFAVIHWSLPVYRIIAIGCFHDSMQRYCERGYGWISETEGAGLCVQLVSPYSGKRASYLHGSVADVEFVRSADWKIYGGDAGSSYDFLCSVYDDLL